MTLLSSSRNQAEHGDAALFLDSLSADVYEISVSDIVTLEDRDWVNCLSCSHYGNHFSCPPYPDNPDSMKRKLRNYERALVAIFEHDPSLNLEEMKESMRHANDSMLGLEAEMKRRGYPNARAFFPYPCDKCGPCHAQTYAPNIFTDESVAFCKDPSYCRPLNETAFDIYSTLEGAGIGIRKYDIRHPERKIDMVSILLLD
jgi:predicted metal-binding protein